MPANMLRICDKFPGLSLLRNPGAIRFQLSLIQPAQTSEATDACAVYGSAQYALYGDRDHLAPLAAPGHASRWSDNRATAIT